MANPQYLETATQIVIRAGEMMMARVGDGFRIDKKGSIDLVTDVDLAIERMARQHIGEQFPDHQILGEEFGGSSEPPDGPCWVLDPLDGTSNFAHGLPIFCCSLALEVGGVAEVGAIFDPNRQELFTAQRGGGAFLNGKRIHVSEATELVDAMLVTGFPYDVHGRVEEIVGLFGAFVGQARAVRRLGSAAIDLCYVAAGRMDAFWESDLKPWDIAAGCLIVEEAGGRVSGMLGEPFSSRGRSLMASNGHLHDAMLDITRRHAAGRTP